MTYAAATYAAGTWGAGTYLVGDWSDLHSDTRSLRDRILANGGVVSDTLGASNAISNADLLAVDTFVRTSYTDGWRSYISDCCPAAGTGLLTAQVKLWYPSGTADKITLINVASGDFSRSTGFTWDGVTKYANTGLNPSVAGLGSNNAHLAVYNRSNNSIAGIDIGSQVNAITSRLVLAVKWSDNNCYWDAYDTGTGRASGSNTTPTGLCLGNRISATDSKIYQRGTQIGSSSSGSSTPGSQPIYWGAVNNIGSPGSYVARSHGGYSIGLGIPAAMVASFSSAWQTLMLAFGRAV